MLHYLRGRTRSEWDSSHQALESLPHAVYGNDIMERKHSVALGNICKDLQNNVLIENTRVRDGYLD